MKRSILRITAALLAVAALWMGLAGAAPAEEGTAPDPRPETVREKNDAEKEKAKTGKLPASEFTLLGVSPGIREEAIRAALGKPVYADFEQIVFASGLIAELDDDHPGLVEEISVAKPGTGVATPAGLTPGMPEAAIERLYGRADKRKDQVLYTTYTFYSQDGTRKMKITVKDGIILKIICEVA